MILFHNSTVSKTLIEDIISIHICRSTRPMFMHDNMKFATRKTCNKKKKNKQSESDIQVDESG